MTSVSMVPTRKVGSGALAGAVTVIGVWLIDATTGVTIPPEVASAITLVLMFVASYFVPDAPTILDKPSETPSVPPAASEGGGVVGPPDRPV